MEVNKGELIRFKKAAFRMISRSTGDENVLPLFTADEAEDVCFMPADEARETNFTFLKVESWFMGSADYEIDCTKIFVEHNGCLSYAFIAEPISEVGDEYFEIVRSAEEDDG